MLLLPFSSGSVHGANSGEDINNNNNNNKVTKMIQFSSDKIATFVKNKRDTSATSN